ncbi:MAG: DNA-formamidopyrimidine glycosylase family protein [Acidimicrobiales bacterium]
MPELVEVELSRRLAERLVGRTIDVADLVDPHASGLAPGQVASSLAGATILAARRRGKLLLLDTDRSTLGLHFGMTGRLVVDEQPAIERLVYSSQRNDARWIRFTVSMVDGGRAELHDPRRLARVSIDPDEAALGPDAAGLTLSQLRVVLNSAGRGIALKARLLDQSKVAGIGNLIADEVLWQAGIAPQRLTSSLETDEVRRLHRQLRTTTAALLRRGGSHTGQLMAARVPGSVCPKDGHPLTRSTVGGRTTFWCPAHQH